MSFIEVNSVTKEFKSYKRQKGFLNSLKSLFYRQYEVKKAVDDITFHIDKGELVGYIGKNGAGKSTTIKMLSGILLPTSGEIIVDGRIPYRERKQNAMHMGIVFGQRSQLYWDLPVEDTFDLFKKMYKISADRFKRNVDFYVELLDMKEFLTRPVRQLSLGQKMRADIAVALLHDPDIVYLDEPTIGLDILAKNKIREFIKEINRQKNTTVILTTHDMDDIEEICNRLIMIDKGSIIYDGSIKELRDLYAEDYVITVDFIDTDAKVMDMRLQVIKQEGTKKTIVCNKKEISVAEAVTLITRSYDITDFELQEPRIEDIIKKIYEKGIQNSESNALTG